MTLRYDILIVGSGPAGLSAALAAAPSGAKIGIVDDNPRAGGQVWRQGPQHPGTKPLRALLDALRASANVTLLHRARVIAMMPPRMLLVEGTDDTGHPGALRISYDRLILATGARERLWPFRGWTLPGVTGAGGLQALIKGGMPIQGERIVIAGSGPLLLAALASARDAGAHVIALVEQASASAVARFGLSLAATPSKLWQAARLVRRAGVPYWTGSVVREACGAGRVEHVTIERGDRSVTLDCERIACGHGLVPNVILGQALGCALTEEAIAVDNDQRTSIDGVFAAGECAGIGGVELARVEGLIAGLAAVSTNAPRRLYMERDHWRRFARRVAVSFAPGMAALAPPPADTLVCRCEDVTLGEVLSHPTLRDAKLQTRCGMGPCQGRVCGAALGAYAGWVQPGARPPFSPALIGTLMAAAYDTCL